MEYLVGFDQRIRNGRDGACLQAELIDLIEVGDNDVRAAGDLAGEIR